MQKYACLYIILVLALALFCSATQSQSQDDDNFYSVKFSPWELNQRFQVYYKAQLPNTTYTAYRSLDVLRFEVDTYAMQAFDYKLMRIWIVNKENTHTQIANFPLDDSSIKWDLNYQFPTTTPEDKVDDVVLLIDIIGEPGKWSRTPHPRQNRPYAVKMSFDFTMANSTGDDVKFQHKINGAYNWFSPSDVQDLDRVLSVMQHHNATLNTTDDYRFNIVLPNTMYNLTDGIQQMPKKLLVNLLNTATFNERVNEQSDVGECFVNGQSVKTKLSQDKETLTLTPRLSNETLTPSINTPTITVDCSIYPIVFSRAVPISSEDFLARTFATVDFVNMTGHVYDSRGVLPRRSYFTKDVQTPAPFAVVSRGFIDTSCAWTRTTMEFDSTTFQAIYHKLNTTTDDKLIANVQWGVATKSGTTPAAFPDLYGIYELNAMPYQTAPNDDDDDSQDEPEDHIITTKQQQQSRKKTQRFNKKPTPKPTVITGNWTNGPIHRGYFYNPDFDPNIVNDTDSRSEFWTRYYYYGQTLPLTQVFDAANVNMTGLDDIIRISVENWICTTDDVSLSDLFIGYNQQYSAIFRYQLDDTTIFAAPTLTVTNTSLTKSTNDIKLLKYSKSSGLLLQFTLNNIPESGINLLSLSLPQHNYYFKSIGDIADQECEISRLGTSVYDTIGVITPKFGGDPAQTTTLHGDDLVFNFRNQTTTFTITEHFGGKKVEVLEKNKTYRLTCHGLHVEPRYYTNLPMNLMTIKGAYQTTDNDASTEDIVFYQNSLTFKPIKPKSLIYVFYIAVGGLVGCVLLFVIIYASSSSGINHTKSDSTQNDNDITDDNKPKYQSLNSDNEELLLPRKDEVY